MQELKNILWDEVVSIEPYGEGDCYDISLLEPDVWKKEANFVATDFVVHNSGMHDNYIRRKRGDELYEIHPLLRPILDRTYGVQVYQEQVMRVLNVVGGIPLTHCEKVRKAISKKKGEIFLNSKGTFVENGQKNLGWTKEQVEDLWSQIESFAEYGFNKSHSTAYAYTSARLLWLKTHYPLEFFTATFICEGKGDKIKEYKAEAERNGIVLNRLNLNNSSGDFNIVGNEIYIGFSNIKGIGEEVSKRIQAGQPYHSFDDFMNRFGTDARVVVPLIALNVFHDFCDDRVKLYRYYEYFKGQKKSREDREKRNLKSLETTTGQLRFLLPEPYQDKTEALMQAFMKHEDEQSFAGSFNGTAKKYNFNVKEAWKIVKKYKRSIDNFQKKVAEDTVIPLSEFQIPDEELKQELKDVLIGIPQGAEGVYYGFHWEHVLEHSPDYDGGFTFDKFDDEEKVVLCIEAQAIAKPEEKKSKKGNIYYTIRVEDANGKSGIVTFWGEDYARFKEELEYWSDERKSGHLMKIRLARPEPGFKSYTFDSPPKRFRHQQVPSEKRLDHRLMLMRWPGEA